MIRAAIVAMLMLGTLFAQQSPREARQERAEQRREQRQERREQRQQRREYRRHHSGRHFHRGSGRHTCPPRYRYDPVIRRAIPITPECPPVGRSRVVVITVRYKR